MSRPGINERWLKGWKATVSTNEDWFASYYPRTVEKLEYYIAHGSPKPLPFLAGIPPLSPPEKSWEQIDLDLRLVSSLLLWKWEKTTIEQRRWNGPLAVTAFTAAYLTELICLYRFTMVPRRGIAPSQLNSIGDMCFTALGLVTMQTEAAQRLARAQLAAYRRRYVQRTVGEPTAAFIVRLLADYLGQEPLVFRGDPTHLHKDEPAADPVMDELYGVWRAAEPAALAPGCLAACDIHTHQAIPSSKEQHREFGTRWTRTPIAVLLVFRLRALLGLENPRIEHPLIDSVLGGLPPEPASGEPDGLVRRLHARMKQEGFDEQNILAAYASAR